MRQIYLLSLLLACLGWTIVNGQAQSASRPNSTPGLELTTEVVDAKFCESDYLRLQLRLRYFNSGNQPVILSRQSNTIMTYFISQTTSHANREKYEQKYSPMQAAVGIPIPVDTQEPNEQIFVILKPAASYEVTTQAHLPFILDGKDEDSDLLRPGRHVLQIRVRTWSASQEVSIKLRERWRTHGYLWTRSIISRPMTFTIAKHPQVVRCSAKVDQK